MLSLFLVVGTERLSCDALLDKEVLLETFGICFSLHLRSNEIFLWYVIMKKQHFVLDDTAVVSDRACRDGFARASHGL